MKTIQEQITIMQHFANGGAIEGQSVISNKSPWATTKTPIWNWSDFDYRIQQPQKKKMWQWIIQGKQSAAICTTSVFYENEQQVKQDFGTHYHIIRPAIWTEIEI